MRVRASSAPAPARAPDALADAPAETTVARDRPARDAAASARRATTCPRCARHLERCLRERESEDEG